MRDISKSVALIQLILALEKGATLNAPDVARKYGVSVRTAQRWMLDLEQIVPLVLEEKEFGTFGGKRYEWRLME